MAVMIPESLPSGASSGEARVFEILQKLPDDCIAYYEPILADDFPGFVIIGTWIGLLVIAIEEREINEIVGEDCSGGQQVQPNPVQAAENYVGELMSGCRRYPGLASLFPTDDSSEDRFAFPFGHWTVLARISREELNGAPIADLTTFFPDERVATRETLDGWRGIDRNELVMALRPFLNPWPSFACLTCEQSDILHALMRPENRETQVSPEVQTAVLDIRRPAALARRIGDGHRIIYGVAGSGKTMLILARARLLARQNQDARILLLCFNVSLAAYLRHALRNFPNVTAVHFDGWSSCNHVTRSRGESNEDLGTQLLERLNNGRGDSRQFAAVFIDEAQDFDPVWFRCVLAAMADPDNGDLVIVSDASQGLYRRTGISWSSLGIQARGRTIHRQFSLHRNYRNTREILRLASRFAAEPCEQTDDQMQCAPVSVECAVRSGRPPVLIKTEFRYQEWRHMVDVVRGLMNRQFFGQTIDRRLQPHEIGVLYPFLREIDERDFRQQLEQLPENWGVVWLSDPRHLVNREMITGSGVKVQTIHSARGIQYRAVVLLWCNDLPRQFGDHDLDEERCLLYVALTRPEDYLVITCSDDSRFVTEIEDSGAAQVIS